LHSILDASNLNVPFLFAILLLPLQASGKHETASVSPSFVSLIPPVAASISAAPSQDQSIVQGGAGDFAHQVIIDAQELGCLAVSGWKPWWFATSR